MTSIPAETSPLYLAEVTVWDPSLGATRVLRYCSKQGFTTKPSETPANAWYNPVLKQPVDVTRNLFTGGNTSGSSIVGLGDLVLLNPNGDLDDLLLYGFDGQSLVVRVTTKLNPAYPADFTTVFSGTMAAAEFDDQTVTIKVRDLLASLQLPFQANKYGGTNVLPNGLDGVATDLAGKVKPVLLGKVGDGTGTGNFAPQCVNTSKQIYMVNDGTIVSVDAVYDRGVPLTIGTNDWTSRTIGSGFGDDILALAYGAGVFVAAGTTGKLYSSLDGVTWTSRTSGFSTTDILGLCFGNGLFVAVGKAGKLTTSPDGTTWTAQTSGFSTTNINAVAYGNGLYVAVGDAGTLASSPDGVVWAIQTSTFTTHAIYAVTFASTTAGGIWVIVGAIGLVATSLNGTAWTSTGKTSSTSTDMTAVAYGSGVFVVAGASGQIYTAPDAVTWTSRSSAFSDHASAVSALLYLNGVFYAAGASSPTVSLLGSSRDGATWGLITQPLSGTLHAFATGAGVFVVGAAGNEIATAAAVTTYASVADLLDNTRAPARGTFKYLSDSTGSYFRLGSSPVGTITCDATQGASSADRTAAQLFNTVILRADASASVNATDLTTLDGLNSAVLGIYIDADTTFANVIDQIAGTVGAGYWPSAAGQWRIKRIDAPTGTPLLSLGPNDIKQPLQIVPTTDAGDGVPAYRCTVNWGRNYTVQTTDLATGVTDDRRAVVAQQWRAAVSTDLSVQTAHPLSPSLSKDTLFSTAADAQTEANRWQALMGTQRYRYLVVAPMTSETLPLDLSDELELVNPRFALESPDGDSGAQFLILDIQPSAADETITYTAWGAGKASRSVETDDGLDWATDDGVLIVTGTEN